MNDKKHDEEIALADIHLDRDTQIRLTINEEVVQRYFDAMSDEESRDKFPPVLLFRDSNGRLWLADGHHRVMAALRRNFVSIKAVIRNGSKDDAVWEAIKANSRNGLPLLNVDIRRAVGMVLAIWPDRSNVMIAEAINCSEITVRRFRDQLRQVSKLNDEAYSRAIPERTIGKDGKSRPATRKKKLKKAAVHESASATTAQSSKSRPDCGDAVPAWEPPVETNTVTTPDMSVELERRRTEAKVKRTQIHATISRLEIQIAEWFDSAPDDMHEDFDRDVGARLRALSH